jgi:thiol:disulfide interchange protein DsbD
MKTLLFAAAITACLAAAPADPVAWKLQDLSAAPIRAGGRFNLKLLATVQQGWHLYSLKPMAEGPIPTRIWIAEGQPFSLAGAVQSPEPQVVQDATFGMEVEVFEGDLQFTLPVRVAPGTPVGAQKLVVSASYQSCNNQICLPPKTVKVELPITVGK